MMMIGISCCCWGGVEAGWRAGGLVTRTGGEKHSEEQRAPSVGGRPGGRAARRGRGRGACRLRRCKEQPMKLPRECDHDNGHEATLELKVTF